MFKKLVDLFFNFMYKYVYDPDNAKYQGLELRNKVLKKFICKNCSESTTLTGPICTCSNCGQVTIFETKLMEHLAISLPHICLDGVAANIDTWALNNEISNMDDDSLYDEIIGLQLHATFPPNFYKIIKQYKETGIWNQEDRRAMEGAYILFYTSLVFGEEQ